MKMPLITGAYSAKSLVAEAQRCINLYGEQNPQDSPFPFAWYPSPGLTLLGTVTPILGNGWRQLYTASNNKLYGVCGNSVYRISEGMDFHYLGNISSQSGYVSMTDNTQYVVIVDGSSLGWQVKLSDDTFSALNGSGFAGGDTVNYMDGFTILNTPDSREWYTSTVDTLDFSLTMFASKSGYSDKLVGIGVSKRYIYLFGEITTEVWFDAGNTPFPMERLPGVFMQYGCMSVASIAQMDGTLYWLAQTPQGNAFVCRTADFNAQHISTFALDNEMSQYTDLNQAVGFTYQMDGHFFYVLTFPVSDVTWQFDMSTNQWNQLSWLDSEGAMHRHRANCYALAYGQHIVGDWENGNLYNWDQNNYTDNGSPIVRIRSFPHAVDDSSNRIHYKELIANMEVGNGAGNIEVPVFLRWSDTRGVSWGNAVQRSLGKEGEYLKSISWRRLGMARDRVFEISWSTPVKTALLGAWVDAQSNNQ